MTNQERLLFEALTADRAESAKVMAKVSMRGYRHTVVDKYTDYAHFIYELLQNADDAGATSARFVLHSNQLLFAHNGTHHFTISDVNNEEEDTANNRLGDINAITSIHNSNKTESSIGKFGIGFKAVFQYTDSPEIYDETFQFRIERLFVPILLNKDHPERRPNETLFVFPFNLQGMTAVQAHNDIANKLRQLNNPILFLSNLKHINYSVGRIEGAYDKLVSSSEYINDVKTENITLRKSVGGDINSSKLWVMSREDTEKNTFSVGFYYNEDGVLLPVTQPAYCFFPTKELTNLNFIIHAPFILTDSREGIRTGVPHNDEMIKQLSLLAADSLIILRDKGVDSGKRIIDESILKIVPTNKSVFYQHEEVDRISFAPFYDSIRLMFCSEKIIPTKDGYVSSANAYWAAVTSIANLFSNSQLAMIVNNNNAEWVFPSISHDDLLRTNPETEKYICGFTKTVINEDNIIKGRGAQPYNKSASYEITDVRGITPSFIEQQPVTWLHLFYKWISETSNRTKMILTRPIFWNQDKKAVPAYDENNKLILFMPTKHQKGYETINKILISDKDTYKFVKDLGIKEPSLKDEIFNKIIPLYDKNEDLSVEECEEHFTKFFMYYNQCPRNEVEDYMHRLSEVAFLLCKNNVDDEHYRVTGKSAYLPSRDLKAYFEPKPSTLFLDYSKYKKLVKPSESEDLSSFLSELGINETPRIITTIFRSRPKDNYYKLPYPTQCTMFKSWSVKEIDGCRECLAIITKRNDRELSKNLWNYLAKVMASLYYYSSYSFLQSSYSYFYRTDRSNSFESPDKSNLKNSAWLMNSDNKFVTPRSITREELVYNYDMSLEGVERLIDFLEIPNEIEEEEENDKYDDMPVEYAAKLTLFDEAEQAGVSVEEIRDFISKRAERKKEEEYYRSLIHEPSQPNAGKHNDSEVIEPEFDDEDDTNSGTPEENSSLRFKGSLSKPKRKTVRDIVQRVSDDSFDMLPDDETEDDEDEYTPKSIDFGKRIESAKEKSAAKIQKISREEELYHLAQLSEKYSVAWFKALLELESMSSKDAHSDSREVSISFSKVEKEPGTVRTLVLKHSNKNIPQFMEDLADIPLVLKTPTESKTVAIEVVNIKSYDLRVKLKTNSELGDFDLSTVTEARIDAQSPVFLIEELKRAFAELELDDSDNLRDNLCEKIEFVFGPPGTGKTTHLAKNILIPLMANPRPARVLVLTPTNKAADVLISRIISLMGSDHSYRNWLVRFGGTTDESIEKHGVFKDKTFDIRSFNSCITVTTIARFPYDYFMPGSERLYLRKLNWDYIVIDEASMIHLSNIIYPLYKKTPKKFFIAGDPFQIQPIAAVDMWKDENIYSMVQLKSFTSPTTVPHNYKVELLTTQYRSIPEIGDVFSKLTYGGILQNYRKAESRYDLHIDNRIDIQPLNIIKFPVSNYESIYKPKRLNSKSNYHIYSAILTKELISYLSECISIANDRFFRIGVIMAYKAQADLIEKMIASTKLPKNVDVQVGTIHGFQGDECDIIFALFNPPPGLSASSNMFLNKLNIINVSISRAQDYLFVLMPDNDTANIQNLKLVRKVEKLIKTGDSDYVEYHSDEIEDIIFGNSHYIEENSFTTGHQSVNVYGLPEMKYEIRSEDTAVDVQIHEVENHVDTVHRNAQVMSPRYGKGEIISRKKKGKSTVITVQFGTTQIEYDEKMAFSGGVLKRIK